MRDDNTRGESRMEPTVYKGDVMSQVWLDSRVLATLSVWLDTEGVMTRFMSEVVRETLEMVVANLVRDGKIEMIEDTEYAREMLQMRYRVNLNAKNKKGELIGGKNIEHNIALSCRRMEMGAVNYGKYNPESRMSYEPIEPVNGSVNEAVNNIQPKDDKQPMFNDKTKLSEYKVPSVEELRKKMKEIEYDKIVKSAEEEKERILADADIDENGVITPHDFDNSRGAISQEEYNIGRERDRVREENEELIKRERRLTNRMEKTNDQIDEEEIKDGES